ncbi:MAG: hypothetical protein RSC68_35125, partial [Acinetobacter sp.]
DSTLMGCVDTLSLTSCMGLFESLRLQGTVPFFNVPSAEYLVAQTITPVENLNRLIYAEYNPEVACEKYLRRMLPRYTKSSKTVLNCAECKQSECIGKQINIVQGMRTYLKQIHPEYTFPWETETQRTNLFRCHDAL